MQNILYTFISKIVALCICVYISAILGGLYGGREALKEFNVNHSTMTIYQKDADFLFKETQNKIWGE